MNRRVAIVSYSFRLPGTSSDRFWQDLLAGRDLVTTVDARRWAQDTFLHPNRNHPGTSYTFAAGSIGDVSTFDAGFFGISPREAALMDPQQRLLLEMGWEAIENAGIRPSALRGSQCGVYIGIASADYSYRMADDLAVADSTMATGNTASIAANRISYVFDLRGPSMAIDTACSSSLVAFHQACRAILSGETTQALAGGISLHLHPYGFIGFAKASMLSRQGRCRVFDASGDGYVRSEGGGIFLLKDYDQALADGDPILAVVAASLVNTDGRKSGLTVPSPRAQAELLTQAYAQAGIDPVEIDYLEAHGTGTAVGDPIETRAIGEALGKRRPGGQPLPIGSVKSNLGHLETASGVAGMVKAIHCLRHREVPATIGVMNVNPNIQLADWNLELVTSNKHLKKSGTLFIGVNSFGFGGANAHVILASPPPTRARARSAPPLEPLPIVVSARDHTALKAAARDLAAFVSGRPASSFYDVAYSAAFHREWHEQRAVVYAMQPQSMVQALDVLADGNTDQIAVETGTALTTSGALAFIYSGNGSQWAGMGRCLLAEEPLFRAAVREVDALFQQYGDFSLEDELAGHNGDDRYASTEVAQPALFALQVGMTRLLGQLGIKPTVVAGHSVGEVAAAWASGALTLADAVQVIYQRSHLQGLTRGLGQMSAVGLGQEAAQQLLDELGLSNSLTLAGINSRRGVTVAGEPEQLARLESALEERNVVHKRLGLDYAFHSPAMDVIEPELRRTLQDLQPRRARFPFYSTVSGKLLPGPRLDAAYWWYNIRQPVLFEPAIGSIIERGVNLFLEIGPSPVLRGYINECLKARAIEGRVMATAGHGDDSPTRLRAAASQAMIAGCQVDWQAHFPRPGRFVQLPNYPWQRERHWHPVTAESLGLIYRHRVHPLLGYPLPQQDLTWENPLDTQLQPLLADHVVGEATVFPGAGFAELALACARAWLPAEVAEIEELEIRSPLLLSDERSQVVRSQVDPQDGRLTISSRQQLSNDPWALHAVARILREAQTTLLRETAPPLPTRLPDFNGSSHALLTRAVGIAYGPAFQCIDHGWIEGDSVLAVYRVPELVGDQLAATHLHPALLDGAFQLVFQVLREMVGVYEGLAFVPTRMGRIAFRGGNASPRLARATLVKRSPRSLHADFALFAADGSSIAVVKGARFRAIRLSRGAADRLRFLAYHATPKPHAMSPAPEAGIAFTRVRSALVELVRRAALKGTHRRYSEEVDPLLDSLCSRFTRLGLQRLASDWQGLALRSILDCQTSNPECEPWLCSLLDLAVDDQSLVKTPDGWEILPDQREQSSAQDIWNSLLADDPDYFQIVHSVGRVGMHLHGLLVGSASLAEICPQESSLSALLRQVLGAGGVQRLGQAVRDLIRQGLGDLPEGRRLGIVEVSEGAPLLAMDACVALDFKRGDYLFASPSASTLNEVVGRLGESFPGIATQLLDGSPSAADSTGAASPICAMAIVTLDFATPGHARQAIEYAYGSLAPGGALIVIGQHPSRWIDFVFGARRAGWSPAENGRWLSNQRPSSFWQQQLETIGLTSTELLEFSPDTLSGPYLLLGKRAETEQIAAPIARSTLRSWVLVADCEGYSARLSDRLTRLLQARGDLVIQTLADDVAQIEALLRETTANYGELDGLVHLAGLDVQTSDTRSEAALERQVARCALAAHIVQACERSQTRTTCWLVTANAANHLLPQPRPWPAGIAADAALWGFGRTMLNEADNGSVRLVDLESPIDLETAAAALDREFEQPDDEQEVVLTHSGERYVPRLYVEPRPDARQQAPIEEATVSLGFQFPGQLRNLRWEAYPRRALAADEIEVDVRATGLNFRDVMYALGLLSDEAIENGFAGPTLGFEFAGTVSRVGNPGSAFNPGDQVVGFGPSSFGNRVVTQAGAIAHIPPGVSCEAAATIPSTFFTVYYALHHLARLRPDERVLIHGAAGGVGIAAIQVAKWIGAEVYATAGSDEKRDFLRLLGVEHIFDSRSLAFADQILEQTGGRGVDVVLNSLAGEAINRNFQVLKPFGRFLELGKRDFYENTRVGLRPFRNNISYFGIDADQLMLVHPELTRRLFGEIMALFAEGLLHPLPYHTFEAEDVVDAFRYMQQARQIGKIVITYHHGIQHAHNPAPVARRRLQLAADASYLVTGGLRGFGLRTAQWLASKGARHLILIGRSGPDSAETRAIIEQLEAQGVRVYATICDVTRRDALDQLLAATARSMPPLKGVVHSAALIDDGLVRNSDASQIRSVLAPKILGARHLHELTERQQLDFFVLFSSATTAFGNPGQASYVAANLCLESLAAHRRALGLCATCVAWGPIDDVGFLARNPQIKEGLQSRMGGSAINSTIALEALEEMLLADSSGLAVLELDWHALSRFLPTAASPKFRPLNWHVAPGDGNDDQSQDIQRLLAELPDDQLRAAFVDLLKNEIGEILRVAPDKIDPDRSLYDMGLDSLMGVELVVALEARFGIRLPVMALSQTPRITQLAERIVQQLRGQSESGEPAVKNDIAEQAEQVAKQQGVDASAEAIASLAEHLRSGQPALGERVAAAHPPPKD
ncbi:MAG: SDR family NAD(P)-dependent oxidoreductase [Candidatus Accumulibacter sp.]|uniref:type I polyketide synthase n=1 Tax=Accumulibacter sp. TaxID=2053492 RepID=UPI001A4D184E|nr:type I polyketide synthase [Accumulibacter sp.]MBL8396049.1 SDR family NAD(P)-dependent oxidoreductase [Accumulibacter sp.]